MEQPGPSTIAPTRSTSGLAPSKVSSPKIDATARRVPGSTYRERVLRRISVPLESLSAVDSLATPGQELTDFVMFDKMNQDVKRGVDKATRRVVGEYLLEAAELRPALEGLNIGSKSDRGFGYDVHFYHTLPKVELKYGAGRGEIGLGLAMEGSLSLTYKIHRMDLRAQPAKIHANFDGDTYTVSLRVGF